MILTSCTEQNDPENSVVIPNETENEEKVIFGGRLAEYRYYDMDAVIASALEAWKGESK